MPNDTKLKKPDLKKILMIALSLLCSLLLWAYVTTTEGDEYTETYTGVSVVFEGEGNMRESKGLIITSRSVSSIKVSITGSRRVLSRLDAADLTAVIDLSNISSTGTYTSSVRISYPAGTDTSTLNVNARSPENVTFVVDKLSTKTVEVKGLFSGSAAEGYSAGALEFTPNSVRISGPENDLKQVADAWVEVTRTDVDKTLSFDSTYILRDADGNELKLDTVTLETPTVTATLPIIAIKEVDLSLNIINGGGATDANVKVTVEPSTITLSGDADTLAGINSIKIDTVDLADITDGTLTETVPIVIPNDTEILAGPKEAKYTLEIRGLETKTLSVSNITAKNVTDGYEVEILQDSLDVTIRGAAAALRDVSVENIRAVADLTDFGAATGIVSAPVTISIDGTTEVGAIGTYSVYVNITKK